MVSRLATILSIFALAVAHPAAAQDRVSLQQAVAATLENNPDIRAANAGEQESRARAGEALASYLPRLDFVETWQRGNNPVYVFGSLLTQQRFTGANFALDALNHPQAVTNHRSGFMLEQPIFDSNRLTAIRASRLGREMASAGVAELRAELTLAVARAYGGVVQAGANRRAAESAVEAARDDLSRARQRRDVGLVTDADVLSLEVHVAQMEERRIRAASAEQIARAQLNRLMGAPLDREITVEEPAPAQSMVPAASEAETMALEKRAAARRASLQLEMARANRAGAKASFLPQVSVQGVYELNGHRFGDRASAWMVSGQLRWNLFSGLGDSARLRAAAAAEARAAAERESVQAALRLDVRTARAELEAAIAREAVGRAAVAQARESHRIIRDRYEAGMTSVTDVLRASTALLDAELLRTSSVVDLLVGQAALDRALGRVQ
jgi:outer membrane protein TolC